MMNWGETDSVSDDENVDHHARSAVSALAAFSSSAYANQQQLGGYADLEHQYRQQHEMMSYQHQQQYDQYGHHEVQQHNHTQGWGQEEEEEDEEEEEEEDLQREEDENIHSHDQRGFDQDDSSMEDNESVAQDENVPEMQQNDNMMQEEPEEEVYEEDSVGSVQQPNLQPRGKPEAMAKALASRTIQENIDELEHEREEHAGEDEEENDMEETVISIPSPPPPDPEAEPEPTPTKPPSKKKKKRSSSSSSRSKAKMEESFGPSLDDPVSDITDMEYQNLEALIVQFCRVPLLAEFSRPVTLLHPELMSVYSKIVSHPVDLGKVCRRVRRREYKNTREVQLDMWRIFANCVKYHSHPNNKNAMPSFVSISLHLRDYFNSLWQEYMIPSDPPHEDEDEDGMHTSSTPIDQQQKRAAVTKRKQDRNKRLGVVGPSPISQKCLQRTADTLETFINSGFQVDELDGTNFTSHTMQTSSNERDRRVVVENLKQLRSKLKQVAANNQEYTVEEFERDLKQCYSIDIFENSPSVRFSIGNRFDRFLGQIIVPIHEANCRGVTQSSIWGCMAAVIWARESSKKPYWPALVLGILAPEDQREDWHGALTERNEVRLPEKLRSQLGNGKRRSEQALKRQSQGMADPQSFFLVEFLGTHEFIWVRESDIIEDFDPNDDPNQAESKSASKKKRSARNSTASVVGSKPYVTAIEEANWAMEEFEMQLQDPCGDMVDDEEEGEEMNYSYSVLCLSDDEADEAVPNNDGDMTLSDIEEANELLLTQGLLDFSATGRKNAKKRAQAMKKQRAEAERKEKAEQAKKAKAEQSKKRRDSKSKEREEKKEQRDLERRRKKRQRARDKALRKEHGKSKKKTRTSTSGDEAVAKSGEPGIDLKFDKCERAKSIVKAYLTRMDNNEDYKNLGLNSILTIPTSMVDSSGILGMALAFRAAAGELPMPDDSGDQETKFRPWDNIDVESSKRSSDRQEKLEKQIEMLQKEIKKVKTATEMRREECEKAKEQYQVIRAGVEDNDKVARQNHYKKKKKYNRGGSRKAQRASSPSPSTKRNNNNNEDTNEETASVYTETDTHHDDHDDDSESNNVAFASEVVPEEITDAVADDDNSHTEDDDGTNTHASSDAHEEVGAAEELEDEVSDDQEENVDEYE